LALSRISAVSPDVVEPLPARVTLECVCGCFYGCARDAVFDLVDQRVLRTSPCDLSLSKARESHSMQSQRDGRHSYQLSCQHVKIKQETWTVVGDDSSAAIFLEAFVVCNHDLNLSCDLFFSASHITSPTPRAAPPAPPYQDQAARVPTVR
jgi:hypothetical protein